MLEYTVANTMAMFEYVRKLSETKTTPELVELTTVMRARNSRR